MIRGRDFVVVSDDWYGLPTSAIHLFRRLAGPNRVFWFNSIGRFPRFSRVDAGKVLRTLGSWVRPGRRNRPEQGQDPAGVHVVNPVMVPWFKPWVRRFNRRSMLRKYEQLCEEHQITDPILVTTFPYAVDFVKAVPGATRIYYCVDEFLDYPGVNHADWGVMEEELLQVVDALIVTSRDLARKRQTPCRLLHLPHGVDFDHFHEAAAKPRPVPVMDGLRRPIAGFFGLLSPWVDFGLLGDLSAAFPDVTFALIGRAEVSMNELADRPNVYHLGYVPYADLPAHARYFDIGLIPFVQSKLTQSINPLKLMEYFALGLPVLATRIPELERIAGPLRLAATRAEFRAGLRTILRGLPTFQPEEAFVAARCNTWDERVEQLSDFLEGLVPARV
jgi:glycosyltransferase involved in cell wall biosynthesis